MPLDGLVQAYRKPLNALIPASGVGNVAGELSISFASRNGGLRRDLNPVKGKIAFPSVSSYPPRYRYEIAFFHLERSSIDNARPDRTPSN
jgi:hypothetical protein